MKYLVFFCGLLRLSLGLNITTADCNMTVPYFGGSLMSGKGMIVCEQSKTLFMLGDSLQVCQREEDQCCMQAYEDMLGMSLYQALQDDTDNFILGNEVYRMRQGAMELYNEVDCKLIMLMDTSNPNHRGLRLSQYCGDKNDVGRNYKMWRIDI